MTYTILVIVQVFIALALIGLILVQHGKGADAGAAFGSGASGTVFGAKGSANFMSRATAALATVFFAVSLTLAYLIGGDTTPAGGSVTEQLQQASDALQLPDDGDVLPSPPGSSEALAAESASGAGGTNDSGADSPASRAGNDGDGAVNATVPE